MNPRDKRNTILTAAGEGLWGFQCNLIATATVLTVLLKSYGAGPRLIGAVAAIESGAILLPQLFGAYLFTSRKHYKRNVVLWHYLLMIPFLLLMGLATLFAQKMSPTLYRWLMLVGLGVFSGGVGIVLATWMDWMAKIFDVSIRGTALGIAMFASAFAGTGGALLAGQVIARIQQPMSYGILYFAGFVAAMASISMFIFIDDPAEHEQETGVRIGIRELMSRFVESMRNPGLREYLVGRGLTIAGFSVMNFIAVHYTSEKGGSLTGAAIVTCGAAMTIGNAIGNLLLGRLGDRRGHRLGALIGIVVQIVSLGILIVMPGPVGCVLAYLTAGFCTAGTIVSHWNIVVEYCPHEIRTVHISACNLVVGIVSVIMPLLAGLIAAQWGTIDLFTISAVISVAAFLWFVARVRDPREKG
jgi:MFS family permease